MVSIVLMLSIPMSQIGLLGRWSAMAVSMLYLWCITNLHHMPVIACMCQIRLLQLVRTKLYLFSSVVVYGVELS